MNKPNCFFFSSRRRHTRSKRDWSSDVCSSDLRDLPMPASPTTSSAAPCASPMIARVTTRNSRCRPARPPATPMRQGHQPIRWPSTDASGRAHDADVVDEAAVAPAEGSVLDIDVGLQTVADSRVLPSYAAPGRRRLEPLSLSIGRSSPGTEGKREGAVADAGERLGELPQVGGEERRPVALGRQVGPRVLQRQTQPRSGDPDRVAARGVAPTAAADRPDLDPELVTLL